MFYVTVLCFFSSHYSSTVRLNVSYISLAYLILNQVIYLFM